MKMFENLYGIEDGWRLDCVKWETIFPNSLANRCHGMSVAQEFIEAGASRLKV